MTPTILYNLHTDGDQYRITKFNDGEVESTYLCSEAECECPAGHRPTCRHRQMLPQMLHDGICNTHWFLDWDNKGGVVDFEGHPRAVAEGPLAEPATTPLEGEILPPLKPVTIRTQLPPASWRRL